MKTPCRFPGCRALLDKSGFCPDHQHAAGQSKRDYEVKRKRDPVLAYAHKVRTGIRWRKVRLHKLAINPLCEDPHGDHQRRGTTVTATQVHHINGLATHPHLAYDLSNLMSVCTRCHAQFEQQARTEARRQQSHQKPPTDEQGPACWIV